MVMDDNNTDWLQGGPARQGETQGEGADSQDSSGADNEKLIIFIPLAQEDYVISVHLDHDAIRLF